MSKEELLEELMQSKIREARLIKGYMVKGVGADKEYILLGSKNTK
jgi:transposase